MNTHRIISAVLLAALLSAFVVGGDRLLKPGSPDDVVLQLIGDLITIKESIYQTPSPAVAYSDKSNQYLVVYDHAINDSNSDIFGRFVDASTGELTGDEIEIAWSDANEYNPDVAYDPHKDVFLVVYGTETCSGEPLECLTNIKGRLVEEPNINGSTQAESPLGPNEFTVAIPQNSDFVIYDPEVAYNRNDHQYLVVYRSGIGDYADTTDLRGQMLRSHEESPIRLGPEKGFHITSSADYLFFPDVAWASGSGTFLVVFDMTDGKSPEYATYQQLAVAWLYDTYQDGSSQLIYTWGKICPRSPLTRFCTNPAVAYDPHTDSFTIVFNYDKKGENWEEMTVYGQRLTAESKSNEKFFLGDPFPIETDLSKHNEYFSPEIVYSGLGSTMYVPYHAKVNFPGTENDYFKIYLRMLDGSQVSPPVIVRNSNKDAYLTSTPLASSPNGQSLVVWGEEILLEYWDLFGQRVGTFYPTYLPSILKE